MTEYQNIRQLYFENLTGLISEDDYKQLQKWLETDENVRVIWSELERESKDLNIQDFLNDIEPERDLERLELKMSGKNVIFPWKLAVASMLVLALGITIFFVRSSKDQTIAENKTTENIKPDKQGIRLTTPDGKAITLAKNGVQAMEYGGVKLENQNGTLTYSGGDRKVALNELYIPSKEDYEIVLADGTKVFLNSESKLKFPFHFSGNYREVYVEGEAFFEVKKDMAHPFIVHTSMADIVVLGTSFNVNTYDKNYVKTSLLAGKVQIKAGDKRPLDLLPGFEVTANTEKTFIVSRFDPDEVFSWRSGLYYFHNKPLGELSSFISRWYGIEIIFDKENLNIHPVSGLLEKGKLEEFLNDLKTTSGINHHFDGNKLHLK
jgi:transmembrane sensor